MQNEYDLSPSNSNPKLENGNSMILQPKRNQHDEPLSISRYLPVTLHVVRGKTMPALGRTQYFLGFVVLT